MRRILASALLVSATSAVASADLVTASAMGGGSLSPVRDDVLAARFAHIATTGGATSTTLLLAVERGPPPCDAGLRLYAVGATRVSPAQLDHMSAGGRCAGLGVDDRTDGVERIAAAPAFLVAIDAPAPALLGAVSTPSRAPPIDGIADPEPGAITLFVVGALGLALAIRRRRGPVG
jgi:hypothetical protein